MKLTAYSKTLLLLLTGTLLLFSCETRYKVIDSGIDYCPAVINMGTFNLTPISRGKYPYAAEGGSKVIFSDSLGNEIEGILVQRGTLPSKFSLEEVTCNNNENEELTLTGERDYFLQSLQINDLNFSFLLSQYVYVDFSNYEKKYAYDINGVSMRYVDPITQENRSIFLNILVDQRNTPSAEVRTFFGDKLLPTFSIHGKEFSEVYTRNTFDPSSFPCYYYTLAEGIVAFEDPTTNVRYKLERIE